MNAHQRRVLRRKWERFWRSDWPVREDATVAERDRWARQDEAALGPRGWVGRAPPFEPSPF